MYIFMRVFRGRFRVFQFFRQWFWFCLGDSVVIQMVLFIFVIRGQVFLYLNFIEMELYSIGFYCFYRWRNLEIFLYSQRKSFVILFTDYTVFGCVIGLYFLQLVIYVFDSVGCFTFFIVVEMLQGVILFIYYLIFVGVFVG